MALQVNRIPLASYLYSMGFREVGTLVRMALPPHLIIPDWVHIGGTYWPLNSLKISRIIFEQFYISSARWLGALSFWNIPFLIGTSGKSNYFNRCKWYPITQKQKVNGRTTMENLNCLNTVNVTQKSTGSITALSVLCNELLCVKGYALRNVYYANKLCWVLFHVTNLRRNT